VIKVLIVDDEAGQRAIVSKILKAEGYELFEAGGVPQALQIIEQNEPAVVLTDLKMPQKGGLALIEEVSKRPFPPGSRLKSMAMCCVSNAKPRTARFELCTALPESSSPT